MATSPTARFKFVSHALNGDGPFRPRDATTYDVANDLYQAPSDSVLVAYPRESAKKFAGRNRLAIYRNPLLEAVSRFAGYLTSRPPVRDALDNPLYQAMAEDIDGKGNALDVFWAGFAQQAKARGSMLLLVDMPNANPASLGEQMAARVAPYFSVIAPESLKDWQIGDDGKFDWVSFHGRYPQPDGSLIDAVWQFDRAGWEVRDPEDRLIDGGEHPLGDCPVLIFTESGDFPCFGAFSEIADLAMDLMNQYSELREIHRSQNFSLLTMQVPDGTTDAQRIEAAKTVGETIGTSNLMVHSGDTPEFIAPPDGPAKNYLESIKLLTDWINQVALNVEMPDQQESGIALQMRFQALNAALSAFAQRMEDLERRAWELSRRWLGMQAAPTVQWRRDFTLADIAVELATLQQMQLANMPASVIAEQQKRIISIQFPGLEQDDLSRLLEDIDGATQEVSP